MWSEGSLNVIRSKYVNIKLSKHNANWQESSERCTNNCRYSTHLPPKSTYIDPLPPPPPLHVEIIYVWPLRTKCLDCYIQSVMTFGLFCSPDKHVLESIMYILLQVVYIDTSPFHHHRHITKWTWNEIQIDFVAWLGDGLLMVLHNKWTFSGFVCADCQ